MSVNNALEISFQIPPADAYVLFPFAVVSIYALAPPPPVFACLNAPDAFSLVLVVAF